jgi:hypothetical protein
VAGVGISVEPGKIAARYLDSNPMAGQKDITRYPKVNLVAINPARLNQ